MVVWGGASLEGIGTDLVMKREPETYQRAASEKRRIIIGRSENQTRLHFSQPSFRALSPSLSLPLSPSACAFIYMPEERERERQWEWEWEKDGGSSGRRGVEGSVRIRVCVCTFKCVHMSVCSPCSVW